ncbi:MAG: hypothetical protein LBH89_02895, partial [Lactococcus lactis]|nr:hypothetical protein [Lactococcus lactis]
MTSEQQKHFNKLLTTCFKFAAKPSRKSRPILTTVLQTKEHLIATDSFNLIWAKHHLILEERLHHKKAELSESCEWASYPETIEFIPRTSYISLKLDNLDEWISLHKEILPFVKAWDKELENKRKRLLGEGERVIML